MHDLACCFKVSTMLKWTLKLIPGVIVDLISEFAGRVDSKQMSRVCSTWHRCLAWRYVSVSCNAVHDCGVRYVLHAIYNEVENRTRHIHITRDRLINYRTQHRSRSAIYWLVQTDYGSLSLT